MPGRRRVGDQAAILERQIPHEIRLRFEQSPRRLAIAGGASGEELLAIIREKICVELGAMNLYFTSRWDTRPRFARSRCGGLVFDAGNGRRPGPGT